MNTMEDRRFPIALDVITPLSVGAGNDNDWVKGLDFVQKDNKVYVIDIQKAAAAGVDIGQLTQLFLKYDDRGIAQLLGRQIENVSRLVFDAPVVTNNNIKTFLRTQFYDKPVVAGSSIKGALRSALFHYLRTDEEDNASVFGSMTEGTDFMRFVRISDIEMPDTVLVNTKIFNLRGRGNDWEGGWKHRAGSKDGAPSTTYDFNPVGFNTLYECVKPGRKGYGHLTLAGNAFRLIEEKYGHGLSHAEKKKRLMKGSLGDLFQVVNQVTSGYLAKEKAFFERFSAERSDELLEHITYLQSLIPADGSSCLLKMSAGVGFHSITGDWQYRDYVDAPGFHAGGRDAGKKKYKSRKVAEYERHLQLMGFVRLRGLSADEASQCEQTLNAQHRERIEQLMAPIRRREADRAEKAAAEQRRRQQAEEERKRQADYDALMVSARQAYQDNRWDEAIDMAKEAAGLYPDKAEVFQLMERSRMAKEAVEFRQREAAANAQKFSQPLGELLKGKTSVGNLIGTMAKWLKADGHTFGAAEYAVFLNEVKKLPPKELKRMVEKRKDLQKVVGEEQTQRLFNALF